MCVFVIHDDTIQWSHIVEEEPRRSMSCFGQSSCRLKLQGDRISRCQRKVWEVRRRKEVMCLTSTKALEEVTAHVPCEEGAILFGQLN